MWALKIYKLFTSHFGCDLKWVPEYRPVRVVHDAPHNSAEEVGVAQIASHVGVEKGVDGRAEGENKHDQTHNEEYHVSDLVEHKNESGNIASGGKIRNHPVVYIATRLAHNLV